jgi:hypothetical protein
MNARTSPGFGAGSFLRLSLVVPSLVLGTGLGCATAPAGPPPPAGAPLQPVAVKCELANRTFKQTSPGACGSSDWRFVLQADGSWQATESGCANASGIARYDGSAVNLEFQYSGGAGRYIWPLDAQCRGLTGTVTWTQGPLTGQTVASTLALVQ